jgi:predicted anti-sigma-YlaC factor YlaD
MSHPPFDEWILGPEPRSPEQERALQAHLGRCETCQRLYAAIAELDAMMADVPAALPERGFVDRWHGTLQAYRRSRERRQAGLAFALAGGAALALAVFLGVIFWEQVKAPAQIANQWLITLIQFLTQIRSVPTLMRIGLSILEDVHPGWWLTLAAMLGGLAALWSYLLYRLAFQRIPNGGSR